MDNLTCPKCHGEHVNRSPREGVVERLLSVGYIYPFRCQLCTHRFKALRWGERYVRTAQDRREYERVPTQLWASIWSEQWRKEGRITDLSVAGAGVETDASIPKDAHIRLTIEKTGQHAAITIDAALVRSSRDGRLGLQFLGVQGDQEARLRQLVHQLLIASAGQGQPVPRGQLGPGEE